MNLISKFTMKNITYAFGMLFFLLGVVVCVSAYVNHVIWIFWEASAGNMAGVLFGAVAVLLFPLGIVHGIWLWF